MQSIADMAQKLAQTHVISFQNPKIDNDHNWAGYSPSTGKYWVNGEDFKTAGDAARDMAEYGMDNWVEVDQCIDADEAP